MKENAEWEQQLAAEEHQLKIPIASSPIWESARLGSITGYFRDEFASMIVTFCGYFQLLSDGKFRGMMTDFFGPSIIMGNLDQDAGTMNYSKVYTHSTSNITATTPVIYNLTKNIVGEWTGEFKVKDGMCEGPVICDVSLTSISPISLEDI